MKKIILCVLLASITLFAEDSATNYKSGLLLPPNGPAIYKQECASCHGEQGEKSAFKQAASVGGKISPAIAGMDTDKVAKDLKEYRYGSLDKYGYGALMKSVTADLSWDEIDSVAKYVNDLK